MVTMASQIEVKFITELNEAMIDLYLSDHALIKERDIRDRSIRNFELVQEDNHKKRDAYREALNGYWVGLTSQVELPTPRRHNQIPKNNRNDSVEMQGDGNDY